MTHDLFNTPPAIVAIDKLDKQGLTADTHKVALAAALLWTYCTRTDLYHLLPLLAFKDSAGRNFTVERIRMAADELKAKQWLQENSQRPGYFQLADTLRIPLYQQLLELMAGSELVSLICRFHRVDLRQMRYYRIDNRSGTIALLRAMLLSGAGQAELAPLINAINRALMRTGKPIWPTGPLSR